MTRKISRLQINAAEANANQILRVDVSDNLVFSNVATLLTAGQNIIIHANGRIDAANVITSEQVSVTNLVVTTDLTTSNVAEGVNLYYTNARVNAFVQPFLTTANVIESASNLYFTNIRARDALLGSNIFVGNVVAQGGFFGNTLVIRNINVQDSALTASIDTTNLNANTFVANSVTSNLWLNLYTANVIESSSNLYYTNARVDAQVDPKLTTANVSELTNLYYTNARVISAVDDFITTSNIDEGINLYYTNARVRSALSGGTGVSYDNTTGVIGIGQNVFPNASVSFGNVIVTGNLSILGNAAIFETNTLAITDPLIQLGKNPVGDVVDLGFFGHYIDGSTGRHAGLFRDASDGQFKLFANLDPEPLTVVDTANASYQNANLVVNYVVGKVTDISNHSTTDLAEGSNLYYTNARVISAVDDFINTSNIDEGVNLYYTNARVDAQVDPKLTTANVNELTNLYYTNARVNAWVQPFLTTANVVELTNQYFTNTRARDALVNSNIFVGNVIAQGGFFGNTLVIRNINVQDGALSASIDTTNLNSNTLTANAISSNLWLNLYTANVIESSSNLYFTNARVLAGLAVSNLTTTNLILSGSIFDTGNLDIIAGSGGLDGNIVLNAGGGSGIVISRGSNIAAGNLNITGDIVDTGNLRIVAGSGGSGNIELNPISGIVNANPANVHVGNVIATGGIIGQSLVIRNINVGDAALQDVAVGGSTANTTVSNTYTQLFGTAQVRIGSAHTIGWNMVWGI